MSENNAISAFDLIVSVPLREGRTVRLDSSYFTPPLTAAAYSGLRFRRGEAHLKHAYCFEALVC